MSCSQRAGNTGEADSHVTRCELAVQLFPLLKEHSECTVIVLTVFSFSLFFFLFFLEKSKEKTFFSHCTLFIFDWVIRQ